MVWYLCLSTYRVVGHESKDTYVFPYSFIVLYSTYSQNKEYVAAASKIYHSEEKIK
jgi:hypothetical protein